MARKKKVLPELKNIEITGVAAEGKAFSKVRINETDPAPLVVFIPYGAPGDIVDIKIDKKKHNYAEGHITQLIQPSEIRVEPACENFRICGGCKWQHMPYDEQLKFKRQQVVDALERIGKIDLPEIPETLGSDEIWNYRNKMEYTFSNKRWKSWEEIRGEKESSDETNALGFHIPGSFDKVLHINKCHLQDNLGDSIRNFLYRYASGLESDNDNREESGYFYDIKKNKGLLRTVMIRLTTTGESMVVIVFGEEGDIKKNQVNALLEDLSKEFPDLTTIGYVINRKLNDSISDQDVIIFKGPGYIEEKMGDLTFRISPKSFYQTNSRQAEKLYNVAAEFAGLSGKENLEEKPLVYDLYTGTGTIANYVAGNASKVIGIEYVEDAIKDARINSQINGIDNTEFIAGDMKDVLTDDFIKKHGSPDIMIVDPPRAGMHEDVIKVILNAAPEKIIYVSCNPATQARDISLLDSLYKVERIQPVDMFPHTHHVENVVKLVLR